MARTRWRLGVVAVLCSSVTQLASGQVTLGTGLRASTVDAIGRDRWLADQVLASALRFDRPWLTAASDGAILRDHRGVWRTAGSIDGALLAPAPFDARFAIIGSLGEPARDSGLYPSRAVIGARITRRLGEGGTWLATDLAHSAGSRLTRNVDFTSGVWRQLGSALVTISLSSRAGTAHDLSFPNRTFVVVDTVRDSVGTLAPGSRETSQTDTSSALASYRWSEAEGRFYWGGNRWSLDVTVGARLHRMDRGAAIWASADGALLLSPRVAVVGGVGTTPGGILSRLPAHRRASLGVRLMRAAPLSKTLPVEVQPAATSFEVEALAPGQYRVAVRVPRARVVELSGDFTRWQAVALQRANGDWWETTLPISPGTHQINIRINGERWVAPPGATVVDDDFAGVVGVIVIH